MSPFDRPPVHDSVRYLPYGSLGQILVPAFFIALFGYFGRLAVIEGSTVTVHCSRATDTCEIARAYGPVSTTDTLLLSSILSVRIDSAPSRGGRLYSAVFVTAHGDVPVSARRSSAGAAREGFESQFDAFRADPNQPSLGVLYDQPSKFQLVYWGFALVWLGLAVMRGAYARVEIDGRSGKLTVTLLRWPLPPRATEYPLALVRDVIVTTKRAGRGGTLYDLCLLLEDQGIPVSLVGRASSFGGPKEAGAQELRRMLEAARPRGATGS